MNNAEFGKPVDILLVEDNPGDVRLTREAFREAKVRSNLHTVSDGEEAMAFLHRDGSYLNAPCPDLVLLDLNLPKKDGRAVLAAIKADKNVKHIPVVVLTTSRDEQDIIKSYELQV
jgi:chemotaxis family two-component system response regulator Rcp1